MDAIFTINKFRVHKKNLIVICILREQFYYYTFLGIIKLNFTGFVTYPQKKLVAFL